MFTIASLSPLTTIIFCNSVILFCHPTVNVMKSILFAAEDSGMTNSDYALFTYTSVVSSDTFEPWIAYNLTDDEFEYRIQAFYSFKQVYANK